MHRRKTIINETNKRRHLYNLAAANKEADDGSGEDEKQAAPQQKDKHSEKFHDNILDRFAKKKK